VPKPIVAIVGRPNVGKSALFNRLVGERVAIVEDEPGTTRDRVYGTTDWRGVDFTLVDTGGLQDEQEIESSSVAEIARRTKEQARSAISEADVIVFMVDAKSGLTAGDYEVADLLRRTDKPTILIANKADNLERRDSIVDFYVLGLGEPIAISSLHGTGTGDLLDLLVEALPEFEEEPDIEGPKISIVGRPNVGKSRLLNALLGAERAIVSDVPGTTRDTLDTHLVWEDEPVTLIDTAGIRRRGRVDPGVEQYSVLRSMRAIDRSDVVLMLIDATEPFTAQDVHITGYIEEQKKGIVVVVNKWDLLDKGPETVEKYRKKAAEELVFVPYAPLAFISAKFGQHVHEVLDLALQVVRERLTRVSTAHLNKMLREAVARHPPTAKHGKHIRFYYGTQVDVAPPTFVFFCNEPKQIHFTYRRYLENRLRAEFGFTGTPIRMSFRGREEP
jgi:GTPase